MKFLPEFTYGGPVNVFTSFDPRGKIVIGQTSPNRHDAFDGILQQVLIIQTSDAAFDFCYEYLPDCDTPFPWEDLSNNVDSSINSFGNSRETFIEHDFVDSTVNTTDNHLEEIDTNESHTDSRDSHFSTVPSLDTQFSTIHEALTSEEGSDIDDGSDDPTDYDNEIEEIEDLNDVKDDLETFSEIDNVPTVWQHQEWHTSTEPTSNLVTIKSTAETYNEVPVVGKADEETNDVESKDEMTNVVETDDEESNIEEIESTDLDEETRQTGKEEDREYSTIKQPSPTTEANMELSTEHNKPSNQGMAYQLCDTCF